MHQVQRLEAELAASLGSAQLRWLEPDDPRFVSRGEIEHPRGLNARTGVPERGGLLCAKIFGTVRPLSCICTKYRGEQYLGVTCEKCGVLVAELSVRSQRFGHLRLPCAIEHPWDATRMLERLLVLPAGYREQPADSAGRSDLAGLNGLYQRVWRHGEQTANCLRYDAPSIMVEHETAALATTVARLFGTPHRRPTTGPTLADHLGRALLDIQPDAGPTDEVQALLACLDLTL